MKPSQVTRESWAVVANAPTTAHEWKGAVYRMRAA